MATQTPVQIDLAKGGRLAPDLPLHELGLAHFSVQQNWRTEDGAKVKREGWDYFAPNGVSTAQRLSAASRIVAQREILRPNGKSAIVAIEQDGKIWAFSFDTSSWSTIATGLTAGLLDWQIEEVAGYAVFNNKVDLPYTWQVGDAAALPIYELREQQIASVGHIKEFNGQLHCEDLTEILDAQFAGIMGGATPYGPVTDPAKVQRISFKKTWSNINGRPRDFAATINGATTNGSPTLTLAYAALSLAVGDEITVIGAGAAGGNLTTTISAKAGATITMANNAQATLAATPVQKTTALNSVVGFYELEDDGAPITRSISFKNRHVILKGGSIYLGYYTGDVDTPYFYERIYTGKRTPRFPRTLVNVGDEYLWWVGDKAAYRWTLGSGAPRIDPLFRGVQRSLFFNRVKGTDLNAVFAVDNPCNNEIFLFYEYSSGGTQRRILALGYTEGDEAVDEIDDGFTAACVIHKPLAAGAYDEKELWFLFGGADGKIVRNGRSNQEVFTHQRYGVSFYSDWFTGIGGFGDERDEKDVHSYQLLMSDPSGSNAVDFSIYTTNSPSLAPTLRETATLNNPAYPGVAHLFYRSTYFQERIRTNANAAVRIAGRIWSVSGVDSRATVQTQA